MDRTRFIEHRGERILLLDYSGIRDPAEALREIAKTRDLVRRQPPKSLVTLTYVRDARYNSEVLQAIKELAAHNEPYVRAGAVVGMGGLHRIALQAVVLFSRRKLQTFDDLEPARDWLAEQARGARE